MQRFLGSEKAVLLSYFSILILIGSVLLYLPVAWNGVGNISYMDSLFTSVSAVCVTGLITVDTASYSFFGKLVILLLIQTGGLGIITFSTLYIAMPRSKISLANRRIIKEYYLDNIEFDPRKIARNIFLLTLFIEAVGALILMFSLKNNAEDSPGFNGIFHAVSAFCNAGFSLYSTSLEQYVGNAVVSFTIMALVVLGGLGFVVLQDVGTKVFNKKHRLSLHTKIVLKVTLCLITTGALFYFAFEYRNAMNELSLGEKIIASLFQSVTPRTAGFDTIAQPLLSLPSKLITLPLMFIGAAPGSIAGGVKVTTFFLFLSVTLRRADKNGAITVSRRIIPARTLYHSTKYLYIAVGIFLLSVFLLTITESFLKRPAEQDLLKIVYECFSAFGTVGLSLGLTPNLSVLGKLVIIFTMLCGRIGMILIAMAAVRKGEEKYVDYPKGEVLIG